MDENELKVTALTQRIGELTSEYEGKIADLRVLVTQQQQQIADLESSLNGGPEVVEGEVV